MFGYPQQISFTNEIFLSDEIYGKITKSYKICDIYIYIYKRWEEVVELMHKTALFQVLIMVSPLSRLW